MNEETGSKKKKIIRIVVIVLILGIIGVWFILSRDSYHYDKVATSQEEIYSLINTAVSKGKGEIYFETNIYPAFIDFFTIMDNAVKDGSYDGCELYALRYEFDRGKNGYDVHLHLSEPSMFASLMTKWRVSLIASKFEDLDDYEKIKGVHDYLVLLNRYVAFEGGAYSALCKGRSSCTGYAFSFYAIMRELGVPVTLEIGGNHAWNRVQLNGEWYNMDVTWDDNGVEEISYNYFLKCDADWYGHHHGGATATASVAPYGKSARDYYSMVPNYILIGEIIIIMLFVTPVAILGIYLFKKKKREAPIAEGKAMVSGNWTFLMPQFAGTAQPVKAGTGTENGENNESGSDRFDIIRKFCSKPVKRDIWGLENGKFFHEMYSEEENKNERVEVPPQVFFDEMDFIISVSRSNNARELCDALMTVKEGLKPSC